MADKSNKITIDVGDYKPNNTGDKPKPVVKKEAIVKPKSAISSKFNKFMKEDAKDLADYIFWDQVVPGIRDWFFDALDFVFDSFREKKGLAPSPGYRHSRSSDPYHIMYGKAFDKRNRRSRERDRRHDSRRSSYYEDEEDEFDYKNVILNSRQDAESIVREMRGRIEEYDRASIGDLCDLLGVTTSNFNDHSWGWENPNDIGIRRVPEGFLITLSRPKYID